MRIGLIARCDQSGLATQTHEFWRHMQPGKTLLINVGHLHDDTTHCNKRSYPERYPGAIVYNDWGPSKDLFAEFLSDVDVAFSAETFYSNDFATLARSAGVRTVLQYNFEFLPHLRNPQHPMPDVFAAPSMWRWDDVPFENKTFLPVPIATDRFGEHRDSVTSGPRRFLHIVGRPAIFDRNGTPDVLTALQYVKSEIRLTMRCQDAEYLQRLVSAAEVPPNVELVTDSTDVRDYWDNYGAGDVMILPRRYGGLCLPCNEALGAGMPVIMTDIGPNNTWLPAEWLVPAEWQNAFMAFNRVDVYAANHVALAAKIDQFATDDDFYVAAKNRANELAKELSWDNLRPEYEKVLSG